MDQLVTLTVDGRTVQVPVGTLLVEAAKKVGIDIPVFCYHPKMEPVAACRMCLVEIERMPRLQAACNTRVGEGMVVKTNTPAVVEARRGVLEMLLTNHPLDCPVCDKGGECPLQNTTFHYGPATSRFLEEKRHYPKPVPLSPDIMLDRERCIMCLRCVRFQREIAGDEALTLLQRGSDTQVGVLPGRTFDSPFSGNTIELCPVGALSSRLFRFRARCWDLRNVPSVCPHCSVGCNITLGIRNNQVLRVTSRENPAVDDGWLCDRGRFGYEFVNRPDRLRTPLLRKNGQLVPASWEEALAAVRDGLGAIIKESGPGAVGGLASARGTNEELYLFQKFFRAVIGTNNVDRWPRQNRTAPFGYDALWGAIADLERAGAILLVGANPLVEQPVLDLRLRKAVRQGAKLILVHAEKTDLAPYAWAWLKPRPGSEAALLRSLLRIIGAADRPPQGEEGMRARRPGYDAERVAQETGVSAAALEQAARLFAVAERWAILYGPGLLSQANGEACGAALAALASTLGLVGQEGSVFGGLATAANAQGAWDMGLAPDLYPGQRPISDQEAREELEKIWGVKLPAGPGLGSEEMLTAGSGIRALYLMDVDLLGEDALGEGPRLDLLIVQGLFLTPTAARAHVVLPGVSFAEKEGTFTNVERRAQRVRAGLQAPGEARPDWRIILGLAQAMGGRYDYPSPQEVMAEIAAAAPIYSSLSYELLGDQGTRWSLMGLLTSHR